MTLTNSLGGQSLGKVGPTELDVATDFSYPPRVPALCVGCAVWTLAGQKPMKNRLH